MNIEYKLVSEAGNISVPLSGEVLEAVADRLPDSETLQDVYLAFASHPDSRVREATARKDHLPEAAAHLLATDAAMEVVMAVLRNYRARDYLTLEELSVMAKSDPRLAIEIANNIEAYSLDDPKTLLEHFEAHADPAVREALAGNRAVPKAILRRMATKDTDPCVKFAARASLE